VPSLFDSATFNERLFFPSPAACPLPPGSREARVEVEPGLSLECRVHPSPGARVAVLFFTGNGENAASWDAFAPRFHDAGASLIAVSYRGYGASEGRPSLRAALADARAVAAAAARLLPGPLVVMGRSLGSASAAEIAGLSPPRCAGVVIESGFSDLVALVARRGLRLPGPLDARDLADFSPLGKLARSPQPLLLLHGAQDSLIPPGDARASLEASRASDRSLVLIEGRGHNDLMLSEDYWDALAAFFGRVAGA
jgi:hypothetical protein